VNIESRQQNAMMSYLDWIWHLIIITSIRNWWHRTRVVQCWLINDDIWWWWWWRWWWWMWMCWSECHWVQGLRTMVDIGYQHHWLVHSILSRCRHHCSRCLQVVVMVTWMMMMMRGAVDWDWSWWRYTAVSHHSVRFISSIINSSCSSSSSSSSSSVASMNLSSVHIYTHATTTSDSFYWRQLHSSSRVPIFPTGIWRRHYNT